MHQDLIHCYPHTNEFCMSTLIMNCHLKFVIPLNVCICRPQKNKKKEKEALATSSDSGGESEERSTDSDEPEGHVKQRKFGPELWHNVVLQEVEKLPSAKEGMSVFELANVEKKELHNALKDGRRWKKKLSHKMERARESSLHRL